MSFSQTASTLPVGEIKDWYMITPEGEIPCRDGRQFFNSDPQSVADAFAANGADIPIDFEHASESPDPIVRAKAGQAAGWIQRMEVRAGQLWAKIAWLPSGEEAVKSGAWRYFSPAMVVDNVTRRIKAITSVALVNQPAMFGMPALASAQKEPPPTLTEEEAKIASALGLSPEAYAAADDASDHQAEAAAEMAELTRSEQIYCQNFNMPPADYCNMVRKEIIEAARSGSTLNATELAQAARFGLTSAELARAASDGK